MNSFNVNEDDNTISLNYSRINPAEIAQLIKMLESNLKFLNTKKESPISVFKKSLRKYGNKITFHFNWNKEAIVIDDYHEVTEIPKANVILTADEILEYHKILKSVLKA